MRKQKTDFELLEGKLRLPIHISYISKYILEKPEWETKEVLNQSVLKRVLLRKLNIRDITN